MKSKISKILITVGLLICVGSLSIKGYSKYLENKSTKSFEEKIDKNAKKFDEISYLDILSDNLKVMDSTAISLCRDNNIPLIVFEIAKPDNIIKIVKGEKIGTLIK